ncbi:mannose-1-phosphate guanylyltransferase/mannose-6-phosphate isomerase [Mesorhizobium opportunistum]|uniref:Mannose-1-phosphate guanylyltransferase/mannose-6-phosphate isomerase n=1 Tax=Mesorhizobium opportunistum TaxID=593909 RepID=A0ABV1YPP0_9HYPH|nr:mannose-1-phosphate guanylyltransferase/mannose-6-phosphate isomerase [Mesorhizobium sp.]TIN90744.1 MAG: mannose-1-phosphate guanylyltransferase/mannose-6-phosphate isomerase [Mesorhizobium sp.]TJU94984.1 MAG: mannose-1-phosphate guanylyltransferase/mannose-6-phosphate isomerase [Mesorhizobium sp.]TJV14407.1 MAG: mannose-1-phosphate guanylyltransferase/mannose-6-phosphate isomerase [Mesorhizobium sp.]
MTDRIVSFVMSGGVGSRLWPLSREDNPKQFHDLSGDGSMLAKTLRRLAARSGGETPIFLIASERHAERVHADLAGLDLAGGGPLFEPTGRNTAAAVALATLRTLSEFGDSLVLVVPSDHEISTVRQFWQSIEAGAHAARAGRLVVFGIKPTQPETGYGYIEVAAESGGIFDVSRFVEKPDLATAEGYLQAGSFYWNTGIFLFRAGAMRDAFVAFQPDIWQATEAAYEAATSDLSGLYMPLELYEAIPSNSIDYAVMERAKDIAMVPAGFRWNDLGSWQSLLDVGPADDQGNVIVGDVVAIDCENSYIRSDGSLLSAIGMKDVAIVSTIDATFIAPVSHSQHVKKIVEQLEKSGRLETRFTPAHDRVIESGAWRRRVHHWLFQETLPLWSTSGVDERHGGFHEALGFDAEPLMKPKRMRTQARQVYAFAVASARGWDGPADRLIAHGIDFMAGKGRTDRGGWVRTLNVDGSVADATEDAYDHSCVLLALAHAHMSGNPDALRLGEETFAFLDAHLEDSRMTGFLETSDGEGERRSNPHMHLLEAFLAWHQATGERAHLRRAARIIDLFRSHFFDPESWTLGEYFDAEWKPAVGDKGLWTEPGHHFEWASLLVDFAERSGQAELRGFARKLYASAIASGLNRATGLAYGAVSRQGLPLDLASRSWPQAEAVKAAIALNGSGGPDLKPEIEARVGRLFRWHIDPAPLGLWIDRIDERGRSLASDVPASIFYHLVCALTQYLDGTAERS